MKKKILLISVFAIAVLVFSVAAGASMLIPANENAQENAKAAENSPVITETDSGEWDLERVDFIHYAKPENPAKPPAGSASCYKLLGVKWKSFPVNYVVNPANPFGLTEEFVVNTVSTSAETWDMPTATELFNDAVSVDYTAQYGVQNYVNAVVFGNHPDSNVIGVTSVWYKRVGKEIVEFDVLLNTDFVWGDALLDPALMDLQNIATHELGHAVGMGDIYTSSCTAVTMYGYSDYGETIKRTLEQPDVAGLQSMYS